MATTYNGFFSRSCRGEKAFWIGKRKLLPSLVCIGLLSLAASGCRHKNPLAGAGQRLDFNQDVQPILARNCFSCHGPDPEMRKAGLRLDLAEAAISKRPGHPDAIVPGYPERSELIKRIESKDPHYLMPQASEGKAKPLKPEEIATLKEWIEEGAVYRPHWVFEKPTRPTVPAVTGNAAWAKNPIDAFVLARMGKQGLLPSPEADKHTLIRRVTLDLTGLLPTPAEVKTFVNDKSPEAYEHLVDSLLARTSYGEQRTRYWLDYARYADTYGLHYDNSRDIWPYRDYVIRAFNSDKPFDQFAKEQIAGDLMPAKKLDPLIASGYVRLGVSSNEGGTIPEELRVNMARERTEAYGATFMGLTVGCAVCHDHKFDPTTQKDFYALSAFFNNIDEKPFNGDRPVWTPVVRIPKPQNTEAYERVFAKREALVEELREMCRDERNLVRKWLASKQDMPQAVSTDKLVMRLRLDEGHGEVLKNTAPNANPEVFTTNEVKPSWGETTWLWPDFRMEGNTRLDLGQIGDFDVNQPFSAGGWIMLRDGPNIPIYYKSGALISKMDSTQHNRGWDLAVQKGFVVVELVNEEPKGDPKENQEKDKDYVKPKEKFHYPSPEDLTKEDLAPNKPPEKKKPAKKKDEAKGAKDRTPIVAIKVASLEPLTLDGRWKHVFFTYDGSGKPSGIKIYLDGVPMKTRVTADSLHGETIHTPAPMQLGWRYPDAYPARETRYQDVRVYARSLSAEETRRLPFEDYVAELAAKPASQWDEDQWHVAGEFYLNAVDKAYRNIEGERDALNAQLDDLSEGGVLTQVAWENPSIAYADVLTRGVYTARTEHVEANTPHFLPPLPANVPHNRLALAEWTVSADNPLIARVTVNRMWNELFGTGIVETTEDFGIMGARPSNPELLDWLAVEFRESGWNVKHMYKLMAMSAVYRQSSKPMPEQLAKDPTNVFLSHGPRFRMDAEMLRDIALQSGGLLVNKLGGPSVKTYQPENVWEVVSFDLSDTLHYVQQHGDALHRRSMYSYWKRMAMLPDMDAFDAQPRDVVCTRRQRTDTPLQALVTMNDVQWVEAARALAERVILEGGRKPEQRIDLMSEILLAHDVPPKTEAVLENSLNQMERHYSADPKAAYALIHVGESKPDAAIPAPELAAWTMVANEMLNLDETLTK
jgi:hypothetical protein